MLLLSKSTEWEGVMTERRAALIAGFSLLLMAGVAGYANLGVIEHPDTAGAGQLDLAAALMGLVAVLDVIVAVALFTLFGRAALLSSASRVLYAGVLAVAVARLTQGSDALSRAASFHHVFDPALGLFGVHLLLLAFVFDRPQRWLAVLVGLAGTGYVIDEVTPLLGRRTQVATITFIGELVLMGWLLGSGGKLSDRTKPAVRLA